jgi:protein-L-isoaspartate O-methyltransferase
MSNNLCAYIRRPLKFGKQHQSAPFLYAKALSALDLEGTEPLQFLNVGSGTGYLQALVANMLPPGSLVHGVELEPELTAQAEER